jgi:acyl-CoA thioester hydrolase
MLKNKIKDNKHPIHTYELTVTEQDLDHNHHVNNVVYIQWMQDAAKSHAEEVDVLTTSDQEGGTWFVREHNIVYKLPAMPNDQIYIETWIENIKGFQSLRKYNIKRKSDDALLASAHTNWVYIDKTSGKPKKISPQFRTLFQVSK